MLNATSSCRVSVNSRVSVAVVDSEVVMVVVVAETIIDAGGVYVRISVSGN